jgi:hypothetical protein
MLGYDDDRYTELAQDSVQWRASMLAAMNLKVLVV